MNAYKKRICIHHFIFHSISKDSIVDPVPNRVAYLIPVVPFLNRRCEFTCTGTTRFSKIFLECRGEALEFAHDGCPCCYTLIIETYIFDVDRLFLTTSNGVVVVLFALGVDLFIARVNELLQG